MNTNIAKEIIEREYKTDIKQRGVLLSNESIVNDIGVIGVGIKEYVRKEFLNIIDIFNYDRDRLHKLEAKEVIKEIKELVKLEPKVKRVLINVKYDKVAKIKLPVPVGMSCSMVEAMELLNKSVAIIDTELIKTIDNLDTIISKVIADEQYRVSNRPIINNGKTKELSDSLLDTINKIIVPSNMEDRKTYEELYPNINSLKMTYETLIDSSKINNSKTLRKIDKLTKNISDKVKTLYDLSENIKTFKVSKPVITNLTTELEDCANFVANSVSIIHLNNQLAGSYTNTIELLDRIS